MALRLGIELISPTNQSNAASNRRGVGIQFQIQIKIVTVGLTAGLK
jgi:hypothetical protein